MRTKIAFIFSLVILACTAFAQKDSTVKLSDISIDTLGNFKWTLEYFGGDFLLLVEQKKNGRWVLIEDHGSGLPKYSKNDPPVQKTQKTIKDFCVVKFHKGLNLYRLKMIKPYQVVSTEVSLTSKVSNDEGVWITGNKILLDNRVYYEILDNKGELISKGEEKNIDISSLAPGSYFLYTKKATVPFTK